MAETKKGERKKAKQWGYDVKDEKSMSRFYETEESIKEALNKVPWDMMDKHLHSDQARQEFQSICQQIRLSFNRAHAFSRSHQPSHPLLSYVDNAYGKAASKETLAASQIQPKLPIEGWIPIKGQFMKYTILGLACCAVGFYGRTYLRCPGEGK